MATTADGLPYPVGTDRLVDGDDAIKALADALQLRGHGLKLVTRTVQCDPVASGYTWFRLPGVSFSAPPAVWIQPKAYLNTVFAFNPDDVRASPVDIGGFLRDQSGLVANSGYCTAFILAIGPA